MKKLLLILSVAFCLNANAQIPTNGLTAYWPFTPTLHANDSTANGNNGVVYGATMTTDRFGNCNQAYKFNGINNAILVHNSLTVDMNSTDFSIAVWIKTYAGDTNSAPISKNILGSISGYLFWANCGNPGYCTTARHTSFYVAANVQQDACSNAAIYSDSSWHFLTGVYNHTTNKTYLYVDTILQTDVGQAYLTNTSNTQNLAFGSHNDTIHSHFNGVLDDIRMYKRILSAAEIVQLYKQPDPGSTCSKVAISSFHIKNDVIIYPNPAQNNFTIETNTNQKQTLQLFDVNGKLILSQSIIDKTTIDVGNLSAGVYNLSLINSTGVVNKKLVIVK